MIDLALGGAIVNGAGGSIIGDVSEAILSDGLFGTVTNSGTIGTHLTPQWGGIVFDAGGIVTNTSSEVIEGYVAVNVKADTGTITNAGTIEGAATFDPGSAGGVGILVSHGTIINLSGGIIEGCGNIRRRLYPEHLVLTKAVAGIAAYPNR